MRDSGLLEEITLLLVADGEFEFLHGFHEVFPDFAFLRDARVMEEVGGVVGQHEGDAAVFAPLSTQFAHGRGVTQ